MVVGRPVNERSQRAARSAGGRHRGGRGGGFGECNSTRARPWPNRRAKEYLPSQHRAVSPHICDSSPTTSSRRPRETSTSVRASGSPPATPTARLGPSPLRSGARIRSPAWLRRELVVESASLLNARPVARYRHCGNTQIYVPPYLFRILFLRRLQGWRCSVSSDPLHTHGFPVSLGHSPRGRRTPELCC
jgi:hypothetical protein